MSLSAATIALAISAALSTGAPSTQATTAAVLLPPPPQTVQQYVQSYFDAQDEPIMAAVSGCESHYRQFDTDGSVYRGEQNHQDVGVMQINEHYHLTESQGLGYDIYTLAGNVAFAQYLYEKEGTAPWDSSSACWDKSKAAPSKVDLAVAVAK